MRISGPEVGVCFSISVLAVSHQLAGHLLPLAVPHQLAGHLLPLAVPPQVFHLEIGRLLPQLQ